MTYLPHLMLQRPSRRQQRKRRRRFLVGVVAGVVLAALAWVWF